MAIIKCKECGGNVSDKAYSCPHCGYILDYEREAKKKRAVSGLAKMALVCIALIIGIMVLIEIAVVGAMFFVPVDL